MTIAYNDFWIRLAGSLVISHFIDSLGRPQSFFQLITSRFYYIDLFFGALITFVLWTLVRQLTLFLDRRYPWFQHMAQRILLQVLLCIAVPAVLSFFLTMAFMQAVWQQNIFKTDWLYNEFSVVILLLVLINGFYFTWWLYQHTTLANAGVAVATRFEKTEAAVLPQPESAKNPFEKSPSKKSDVIEVQKGGKTMLLPHAHLAYAFLQDGYCYLKTTTPETFVTTYALDDLFGLLDEADFFRANRQMIIHRKACKSYSSLEHGKILVELEPAAKEPVIVSQKRAKAFRDWIAVA